MISTSKIYIAGHKRQQDVEAFFEKERPEYVFLAAAKVGGIFANSTYKAEFIYDNITIAANIIQASYKAGVKKLLNLGSSCIYPKLAPQPLKEEYLLSGPLEPTNEPYAIAKILMNNMGQILYLLCLPIYMDLMITLTYIHLMFFRHFCGSFIYQNF